MTARSTRRGSRLKARGGFGLIDVLLATVIVSVGMMAAARLFTNAYEQLIPNGEWGGLRRYVIAEAMLKAQAEGLRALRYVPVGSTDCKLITEPPNSTYMLDVMQFPVTAGVNQELYYFDLDVQQHNQPLGMTLSVSTLRTTVVRQYEKIGL